MAVVTKRATNKIYGVILQKDERKEASNLSTFSAVVDNAYKLDWARSHCKLSERNWWTGSGPFTWCSEHDILRPAPTPHEGNIRHVLVVSSRKYLPGLLAKKSRINVEIVLINSFVH